MVALRLSKDKARSLPIKGTLGVVVLLAAGLLVAGAFGGVSPLGFTSSGGTGASSSHSAAPVATSRTAASNYLVTFSHGTSSSTQAAAITAAGATVISSIAPLSMDTIKVPAGSKRDVLAALRANRNVAGIAANMNRQSEGSVDPAYPDQWNLPQIGWDKIYGSVNPHGSTTIAVLDTGVSGSTGDLNLGSGWSAFGTDPTVDPNGHGTAVASIAAATAGDGIGVAGVDFANTTILPVQVLNSNGLGLDSDIVQGVVWAADHGANVILMSFSNPGYSQALQDAVSYAWSKGAVVVAATGNGVSDSPTYPAGDTDVMGVAGTDQSDAPWAQSNTGADTFLAAPATNIPADATDGSERSITGTSASAAEVAGAAALVMANDPSATNAIVDGRLAESADAVGSTDQTGNGRLNLARAFADTSTHAVTPLGAPGGGPVVGPYVSAPGATARFWLGCASTTWGTTTANNNWGLHNTDTCSGGAVSPSPDNSVPPLSGDTVTVMSITNDPTINGTSGPTANGTVPLTGLTINSGKTLTVTSGGSITGAFGPSVSGTLDLNGGALNVGSAGGADFANTTNLVKVENGGSLTGHDFSGGTLQVSGSSSNVSLHHIMGAAITVSGGTVAFSENFIPSSATVSGGTIQVGKNFAPGGGFNATGGTVEWTNAGGAADGGAFPVTSSAYSPATTVTAAATGTSVTASGTAIQNGDVILVENEQMLVTGGGGTTSLTVVRGYDGTTAAMHAAKAATKVATYKFNNIQIDAGADPGFKNSSGQGASTITAAGSWSFAGTPAMSFGLAAGTIDTAATYFIGAMQQPAGTYGNGCAGGCTTTDATHFPTVSTGKLVVGAGQASKLVITQQPTDTVVGGTISAVTVAVEDSAGNVETTDNSTQVSLAIGTNPSSGTLTGGGATTVTSGSVTFSGLSINKVGSGYTLVASSTPVLTTATSNTFNITGRSSSTSVSCATNPVTYGGSTLCTATVTDSQAGGTSSTPGGTVAFSSNGSGTFTSSGTCTLASGTCAVTYTPSAVGTGTHQISATYTSNDGIHSNSSSSGAGNFNVTVNKATLTVTPDPQSRTYGQAAPSYTFSVTGFQNSETAGTASGYVAPSCTSDYTSATTVAQSPRTISCSGGSANNYNFNNTATANLTVGKATLTVTPDPQSRSYGQAAPSYTFSVTGFQNSETAGTASGYVAPSCTSDYTSATTVAQSPRTISCSGGSANNYNFNNTATANLTVGKATLTVTPDPQSRSYGQAAPSYTFSVTGFQNSETAGTASSYVAPSCSSDYTTSTTVAQSPRTISCSGGSANNYSFNTSATANLTVGKASLTVTPDPQSRTYGQAAPSYTFSVTGFQNSQTAGTASGYSAPSCTSDYTVTTTVAQSPRTISCSGGSADNYSFNNSATANLTVSKASLTVTPDPQSRSYGQAAPSYTFSVTGFQNGQTAGTASGYSAPSCTSDYTTTTTVAQSPRTISCSGGSADNYSFNTSATANLTVGKASLTVTPDPQSRTYGQAAPSYTFSVTGFQNSQTAGTASGYSAPSCTSDYTVTTTVAQSPRTISCSGGSADNYSFNTSATANLTVSKASLTVTPDPQSRTYGQAAPSYTFSVTGFQNSQTAGTASGYSAPSCTSDYTVTTTVAQSPRTISCSGGSADNYSFNTSATANLTVGKATLTVTPDPQSRSYGQAAPSYTFSVTGFQNSENAGTASGYVAPSCSSDYTSTTTVAQSPRTISCSGGSADNYSFDTSATANLTVTKANTTTTVTCSTGPFMYSGVAQTPCTASVTGPNGLNLSPTPSYSNNTNAGTATASYNYAGGANYNSSSDSKNFTIAKATLTVTPDPQSRSYGQAAPSYTFSVTGFQNSENAGTASGYVAPSCTSDYTSTTTVAQSPRTISCSGGSADNYSFDTSATANLTVTKANTTTTVTCSSGPFTYSGLAQTPCTASVTGPNGLNLSPTPSYSNNTNAGTATASYNYAGGANYNSSSDSKNFTIGKATLTVTPDPQSRSYGQAAPSYTFSVTGFQNSENAGTASNYSAPSCSSDYTTATTVAQSPRTISCSGGSADNYSFDTSATANLTVGKATLTVTPDPQSRSYGQAAPSYTFSVTGFQNSQNAGTASGYVAPSCTSDYTTATTVAQSPRTISCSGGSADNYSFDTSATANLTVGKASLTVTPDPQSRTYGDTAPSYTFSVTGFQNSQNAGTASGYVAPSCTSDYTTTTTVAQSPRTISCSGGSADNYSFNNSATANLSIAKRPLTVTAGGQSKVYGTSLSLGTSAFGTNGNEANSEHVTSVTLTSTSGNDASTTAPVGTYSGDIVPSAATGSNGFLASNYNITYANGDLTITKASFTKSSEVLINGQPTVGTTLTITNGVYSPTVTTRSDLWELCDNAGANCSPIMGATSNTYTPVASDVTHTLRVVETVSRANYYDGTSTSIASSAVIKGSFTTSTAVSINGTPTVDTATTLTAGSYSPTPTSSSYQWELCNSAGASCSNIGGATTNMYTPDSSEVGSTLRVVETVSKNGYNDRSSTSASAVVVKGAIATTTAVAINGATPKVGTPSTVTAGTYSPSPTGRSYQWEKCDSGGANCGNISGATASSYTPVAGDVTYTLRVVETVTKDGYSDGSSTSAASAAVVKADFSTTTAVSLSNGTPTVGTATTSTAGSYTPTPTSASYQWESCDSSGNSCSNIGGANSSSYTPVAGDVNHTLRVVETVSKNGYNNGNSTSGASPLVVKANFSTTTAVAINGTPTVGTATTITSGVYSPSPASSSYQWELCDSSGNSCSNIGGANSNTYTPVAGQEGSTLRVIETASKPGYNDGGSTSSAVTVSGIITTTTAVAINGTPTVGTATTITNGAYSPSPAHRSYQWERCDTSGNNCVAISGATYNTYTPVPADAGKTLRVVETATKSQYADGGSTSAASALVAKGTFVMNSAVAIYGYPKHGVTSSITQGSYTPTPTTRTYKWLRCSGTTNASCVTISGATKKTYKPGSADIGKRLRVVETVSAPGYNNLSVTSAASTKVT